MSYEPPCLAENSEYYDVVLFKLSWSLLPARGCKWALGTCFLGDGFYNAKYTITA